MKVEIDINPEEFESFLQQARQSGGERNFNRYLHSKGLLGPGQQPCLSWAKSENVKAYAVDLSEVRLVESQFINSTFDCINAEGIDMDQTRLVNTSMRFSNAPHSYFDGSDLRYMYFTGSNLIEANFEGATFEGTCSFKDAVVIGIVGIEEENQGLLADAIKTPEALCERIEAGITPEELAYPYSCALETLLKLNKEVEGKEGVKLNEELVLGDTLKERCARNLESLRTRYSFLSRTPEELEAMVNAVGKALPFVRFFANTEIFPDGREDLILPTELYHGIAMQELMAHAPLTATEADRIVRAATARLFVPGVEEEGKGKERIRNMIIDALHKLPPKAPKTEEERKEKQEYSVKFSAKLKRVEQRLVNEFGEEGVKQAQAGVPSDDYLKLAEKFLLEELGSPEKETTVSQDQPIELAPQAMEDASWVEKAGVKRKWDEGKEETPSAPPSSPQEKEEGEEERPKKQSRITPEAIREKQAEEKKEGRNL